MESLGGQRSRKLITFKMYEKNRKKKKQLIDRKLPHVQLCMLGENVPESRQYQSNSIEFLKSYFQRGRPTYQKVKLQSVIKKNYNIGQFRQKTAVSQTNINNLHFDPFFSITVRESNPQKPPPLPLQPIIPHRKKQIPLSKPKQGTKLNIRNNTTLKVIKRQQQLLLSNESSTVQSLTKPLFYFESAQLKQLRSESFIVMDSDSQQIIVGNYYRKQGQIASLTKIMTFYTIIQLSAQLKVDIETALIRIRDDIQDTSGTSAQLIAGDEYTVEQLLYGLMLPSGNDAAVALAQWGGGLYTGDESRQQRQFIDAMNREAKKINLGGSVFGNPHGLPHPKTTSTPHDLGILVSLCMRIPLFKRVVATEKYSARIKQYAGDKVYERDVLWENTNKLLRRKGFVGVKTGVTVTAGPCLASCYRSGNGRVFIIILLRANKLSRRFKETRLILGWTLQRINRDLYQHEARNILINRPVEDSDNSEDEQEFNFQHLDAREIKKRIKIITYEM